MELQSPSQNTGALRDAEMRWLPRSALYLVDVLIIVIPLLAYDKNRSIVIENVL